MKPGNRQFIEMVPIHTKPAALKDGRKDSFDNDAFLPLRRGFLFY
jgi:hypothetical protein